MLHHQLIINRLHRMNHRNNIHAARTKHAIYSFYYVIQQFLRYTWCHYAIDYAEMEVILMVGSNNHL